MLHRCHTRRFVECQIRVAYAAGPCGFGLHDRLQADGLEVLVVPPSLIPVESGNKVKTDRRDSRKLARLRPSEEWQVSEFPELRIVSDQLWEAVEARFKALAAQHPARQARGRLCGRNPGSPSSRGALFSGLLQCGICGGGLVIANGSIERGNRRYACGFHRNKGPQICTNALTVKESIVEGKLVAAIQERVLQPEALAYVVRAVNRRLQELGTARDHERRRIEELLQEVTEVLRNIEKAILTGMAGETTAKLLREYETRKEDLCAKLVRYEAGCAPRPDPLDTESVGVALKNLQGLFARDPVRVNAFFREHLTPIICTPVEKDGQRFYRARGAAHGGELLKTLGLFQEVDFGGCGGAQPHESQGGRASRLVTRAPSLPRSANEVDEPAYS